MNATSSTSPETPLREGDIIGLIGAVRAIEDGMVMVQFDDPNHEDDNVVPFDAATLRLVRRITKVGDIVLNPQNERVIVHNISNGNMAHVTKEGADLEEADSYQTLRIGQLTHIGQVSESQFGSSIPSLRAVANNSEKTQDVVADSVVMDSAVGNETSALTGSQDEGVSPETPSPESQTGQRTEETVFNLDSAKFDERPQDAEQDVSTSAEPDPATDGETAAAPETIPVSDEATEVSTAAEAAANVEEAGIVSEEHKDQTPVSADEHQNDQDEAASAIANIRESRSRGSSLFERTDLSQLKRQPEEP